MKVLQDNHYSFHYTCKSCHSVLHVSPNDLKGGDCEAHSIKCPLCKTVQFLTSKQIPAHVLHKLELGQ